MSCDFLGSWEAKVYFLLRALYQVFQICEKLYDPSEFVTLDDTLLKRVGVFSSSSAFRHNIKNML